MESIAKRYKHGISVHLIVDSLLLIRKHHALWQHSKRKDRLAVILSTIVVNERSEVENLLKQILFHSVVVASLLRMTGKVTFHSNDMKKLC